MKRILPILAMVALGTLIWMGVDSDLTDEPVAPDPLGAVGTQNAEGGA